MEWMSPAGEVTGLLSSASLMALTSFPTSSSASWATNQLICSARALTVNCNCATSDGAFMAAICAVDVDGVGAVSRSRFAVTVLAVLPTGDLSVDRDFVALDFVDLSFSTKVPKVGSRCHRALRHPHGAWPSLAPFYL